MTGSNCHFLFTVKIAHSVSLSTSIPSLFKHPPGRVPEFLSISLSCCNGTLEGVCTATTDRISMFLQHNSEEM